MSREKSVIPCRASSASRPLAGRGACYGRPGTHRWGLVQSSTPVFEGMERVTGNLVYFGGAAGLRATSRNAAAAGERPRTTPSR